MKNDRLERQLLEAMEASHSTMSPTERRSSGDGGEGSVAEVGPPPNSNTSSLPPMSSGNGERTSSVSTEEVW